MAKSSAAFFGDVFFYDVSHHVPFHRKGVLEPEKCKFQVILLQEKELICRTLACAAQSPCHSVQTRLFRECSLPVSQVPSPCVATGRVLACDAVDGQMQFKARLRCGVAEHCQSGCAAAALYRVLLQRESSFEAVRNATVASPRNFGSQHVGRSLRGNTGNLWTCGDLRKWPSHCFKVNGVPGRLAPSALCQSYSS